MAKKRKRRRTSFVTKGLNILTLAIGISPLINHFLTAGLKFDAIIEGYSAGLSSGTFRPGLAAKWYGPIVAAIIFRKGVSMLRKVAHV